MQFFGTVLYVEDVPATMDFYCRTFQFSVRFYDEPLGFAELDTGASPLAIAAHSLGEFLMPGHYVRGAAPGFIEIGFLTSDVPAAFARTLEHGATAIAAPKRMPWGLEVAYVRAPEGTIIGLSEPPPAAAPPEA